MIKFWQAEPAVIVSLVTAIIALAVAFGLNLTPEQTGSITAVVTILAGLITRTQVSSTPPKP